LGFGCLLSYLVKVAIRSHHAFLFTPPHKPTISTVHAATTLKVVHELDPGDAILFHSEALHNVLTVTRGLRQSLVIELWTEPKNSGIGRYK
jgi:hypothetical protein